MDTQTQDREELLRKTVEALLHLASEAGVTELLTVELIKRDMAIKKAREESRTVVKLFDETAPF